MLQHNSHNHLLEALGPGEVYPGLSGKQAAQAALAERRSASRFPVIKSAKVVVGAGASQAVYDCLVLDESSSGVLIDLGTLVILPDEVTLQLSTGATYLARRAWGVGTKAGLEFLGGQIITGETAQRMLKVSDVLQTQGVPAAVATLRGARFFDHAELRKMAEEIEAAFYRFEAVLNGRQSA